MKLNFFNRRLWGLFLLAVFLLSCSGSNFFREDLNRYLTDKREYSTNFNFSILLAPGWAKIIDNKNYSSELWLVNSNMDEIISVNKINIVGNPGENTVLSLMKSWRVYNHREQSLSIANTEIFINQKKYSGFYYKNPQGKNVFVYLCDIDNSHFEYVYITERKVLSDEAVAMLSSIEINNKTMQ